MDVLKGAQSIKKDCRLDSIPYIWLRRKEEKKAASRCKYLCKSTSFQHLVVHLDGGMQCLCAINTPRPLQVLCTLRHQNLEKRKHEKTS